MAEKLNCWEFKKCGREQGGAKVRELGVCPASTEPKLNNIHGGKNAGRACWIVAGTFCNGEIQGSFAMKFQNCSACDFYVRVKSEEAHAFKLSPGLIALMKK